MVGVISGGPVFPATTPRPWPSPLLHPQYTGPPYLIYIRGDFSLDRTN